MWLGGKEWFVDTVKYLFRDAGSVITYYQFHIISVLEFRMVPGLFLVQSDVCGLNSQVPAIGHGISGIYCKIDQGIFQFTSIDCGSPQIILQYRLYLYGSGKGSLYHVQYASDQVVNVVWCDLGRCMARER